MYRRRFAVSLGLLVCNRPVWSGSHDDDEHVAAPPGLQVSQAMLAQSVAQRFPVRYPVPGLLNLDVQVPRLRLLPEQNRLAADMAIHAAGPALNRIHNGSFEVDFLLRYEASDRTVRAHRLRFDRLRFPTLAPAVVEMLNTYAPMLAQQVLNEVVLHQLSPQELAMADALNMQPDSITVTDQGLLIGLVLKPL